MRISDTKVVQFVEADPPMLVVKDDTSGAEATLTGGGVVDFLNQIAHSDTVDTTDISGVSLTPQEQVFFALAAGMFWLQLGGKP